MNTISSLFNWLGNLVGANPNTMTTTSKTIVGAINEVDGDISTISGDITNFKKVASFYSSSTAALAATDKNAVLALTQGVTNHGYTISNNGDANDGGVIVPKKGWYLVGGRWHFNTLGSGANTLTCAIKKYDGSNTTSLDSYGMTHTGGYHAFSTPLVLYKFNQGDIVFASARNNTAAVGNFGGGLTIQLVCEEA